MRNWSLDVAVLILLAQISPLLEQYRNCWTLQSVLSILLIYCNDFLPTCKHCERLVVP